MFGMLPFFDRTASGPFDYGGGGLLDDLYSLPIVHRTYSYPRRQNSSDVSAWCSGPRSDSNTFQVMLNVKHFRPEEIDVKTVDDFVVIHGKHEEAADEHGFISREFTRRYRLPEGVEPESVTSSLSQGGVLTIRAPMKALEPPPSNERVVPIVMQEPTEQPKKSDEQQ